MSVEPNSDPLANDDLVESKIEDFIKLRMSQMSQKEMKLAQSMIGVSAPGPSSPVDPVEREKDLFKIHRKEDDYFEKLSDLEQVRLYTTLHDHNQRLRESIQKLKKEYITLLQKREGTDKLDMKELQQENKELREELRQLTLQHDKNANTNMTIPAKQKKLLNAYGPTPGASQPKPHVIYTDKNQVQTKIDEVKGAFIRVENQIKECHLMINHAGISMPVGPQQATHSTVDLPAGTSPKELKLMVAELESRLEGKINEREILEGKNRAMMQAIQAKMDQLKKVSDENLEREDRYLAIRSRDPFEMKNEIKMIQNREADLRRKMDSLRNLPMYKNDSGVETIRRLEESDRMLVDLKGQTEVELQKLLYAQDEVQRLKRAIEDLNIAKQNTRKDMSKVKALYEAGINRQNQMLFRGPNYISQQPTAAEPDMNLEAYNEKLIRTLGLVRWKGEEPAWYKLQFLDRARRLNPKDTAGIKEEFARLLEQKKQISIKLDTVEGQLKSTVELEKKREDEHLLIKKRKEHDLMRASEQRKELQNTLDRIGTQAGKVYVGKNLRTGEDVFYNDAVSVFSMDKSDLFKIKNDDNLLDLYLDKLDLDSMSTAAALEAVNIPGANPSLLVSIIGVNFFNHPTLTSQKCFGVQAGIRMQCAFAFQCDSFFIEYCKNNSLDVEIFYANEHGYHAKFAVARIDLRQLIEANLKDKRDDYIGVINSFARVQSIANEHIGIVTFRLKTRLPIYRDLASYSLLHIDDDGTVPKSAYDAKHMNKQRRLNVKICNGYGFSSLSRVFVTHRFMAFEDFSTQAMVGANPQFDSNKVYPLLYNKGVRDFLRNEKIEFTAFDDSIPFRQKVPEYDPVEGVRLKDVVGSGSVGLMSLTYDKPIVEKVYLKDLGGRINGSIFVKIFWEDADAPANEFNEFNRKWEDELSKRIIQEMKNRKMTLKGLFNCADSDSNAELSKLEFARVVKGLLEIRASDNELDELWKRITRGTNKDTVSMSQFMIYFGNLLSADLLGGSTIKDGVKGVNNIFNANQLDQAIELTGLAKLLSDFSDELKRVMKEQKMNERDLFMRFDTNKDTRIRLYEFKAVSESLKLKVTPAELDAIFNHIDKDKQGDIDLAEFFRAVRFDMKAYYEESRRQSDDPANWSTEKILLEFLNAIRGEMKRRNMTVYQLYSMIDKSKDANITRAEMQTFITQTMGLKLPPGHLEKIINEIDDGGKKGISTKEFVQFMQLEDALKILNDSLSRKELIDLKVMKELYEYANNKEISSDDLILEMDNNQSGSLDIVELGLFVKKLNRNIDPQDIERFLLFVDRDNSSEVSSSELRTAFEAYFRIIDAEHKIDPQKKEELLKKLLPLIEYNKESLRTQFMRFNALPSEKKDFLRIETFKEALRQSGVFDAQDIELIVNPICYPITKHGRIRYEGLFDLKNIHLQYSKLSESGIAQFRGRKLVDQLFKALRKVSIKHKINDYQLFQCFDIDHNGSLSVKEMRKNLTDMKIDITEDQFNDIIQILGGGKGEISFFEFRNYLKSVST